jgi:hypothetical protein
MFPLPRLMFLAYSKHCKALAVLAAYSLSDRAMYNVLMILLHRPFVADGHLYSTSRAISVNSFMSCATASSHIVRLVRVYDKAFSVRRAPYLISYATYVAATIHARVAAKRGHGSDAHSSLEACLAVFRENQETNWAVRRANAIVQGLMKRLGVTVSDHVELQLEKDISGSSSHSTPSATFGRMEGRDNSIHSIDIDGIIQSFVREQETSQAQAGPIHRGPTADMAAPTRTSTTHQNGYLTSNNPQSTQQDTGTSASNNHGSWSYQDSQLLPGEAMISLDDLLYGFNSSALDSFPVLEWDGM